MIKNAYIVTDSSPCLAPSPSLPDSGFSTRLTSGKELAAKIKHKHGYYACMHAHTHTHTHTHTHPELVMVAARFPWETLSDQ